MELRLILFFDFVLFVKAIFDEGSTKTYHNLKLCENSDVFLFCRGGGKITDVNISTIMNDLDQNSCTHSEGTIIYNATNCVGKSSCRVNYNNIDFSNVNNRTLKLTINYRCLGTDVSDISKDVCPGDLIRDINCPRRESIKITSVEVVKSLCWKSKTKNDNYCDFTKIVIKACDNKQMCLPEGQQNMSYRWEKCFKIPKLVNIYYSCSELTDANNKWPPVTYPAVRTSSESDTRTIGEGLIGSLKREIIVYSTGTGGFICVVLFLLCICHYKLKNRNLSVDFESNITENNVSMSAVSTAIVEGIYETIDESNMVNVPLEVTGANIIDTTSSEETTESEHSHSLLNNEYLNPYQQLNSH